VVNGSATDEEELMAAQSGATQLSRLGAGINDPGHTEENNDVGVGHRSEKLIDVPKPTSVDNETAPGPELEDPKAAPSGATEPSVLEVSNNETAPGTKQASLQVTSTNTRFNN
jgi:hypothetical protein